MEPVDNLNRSSSPHVTVPVPVPNPSTQHPVPILEDEGASNKKQKKCEAWAHYKMMKKKNGVTDRDDRAMCNYCRTLIMYASRKNGTSANGKYLKICKKSPLYEVKDKRQSTLRFEKAKDGTTKVKAWKFNQDKAKLMCKVHHKSHKRRASV